ncbi:hypothetical protein KFK09_019278 [Dendrobium nobile]|uniref:Uncharacterized protein n=1 Tax=Dendrobium nobile TaxID=94219 RepID=A0A8T3AY56_DENNO|nr:hypothetical protein KFK09_019278 [Dendrobium nobile]
MEKKERSKSVGLAIKNGDGISGSRNMSSEATSLAGPASALGFSKQRAGSLEGEVCSLLQRTEREIRERGL